MIGNEVVGTPFCPLHPRDQVVHICMDASCTHQALLCLTCSREAAHAGHHTIPFLQLISDLDNLRYGSMQTPFADAVKSHAAALLGKIEELRQGINLQLDCAEEVVNRCKDEMLSFRNALCPPLMADQINWRGTFAEILDTFVRYRRGYLAEVESQARLRRTMTQLEQTASLKMRAVEEAAQVVSEVLSLMVSKMEGETLKWSPSQKHEDLTVNGQVLSRSAQADDWAVSCLGKWPMNTGTFGRRRWSVRILQKSGNILLGVAKPERVTEHQFKEWNWRPLGHGNYVIKSSGFTYSDTEEPVNYKKRCFAFAAGDSISMELDFGSGRLTFQKGGERFEMAVERGQGYHAVAYLQHAGDSIELAQL